MAHTWTWHRTQDKTREEGTGCNIQVVSINLTKTLSSLTLKKPTRPPKLHRQPQHCQPQHRLRSEPSRVSVSFEVSFWRVWPWSNISEQGISIERTNNFSATSSTTRAFSVLVLDLLHNRRITGNRAKPDADVPGGRSQTRRRS
jgi:hypothetical protein